MRILRLAPVLAALCAVSAAFADTMTGRTYYQPRLQWSEQALMLADDANFHHGQRDSTCENDCGKCGNPRSLSSSNGRSPQSEKERGGRACCSPRFTFGSVVQFESSTSDKNFAPYFLPGGKNNLVVSGAAVTTAKDISASWLQVVGENGAGGPFAGGDDVAQWFNEYSSVISLEPHFERTSATAQARYGNKIGCMAWQLAVSLPVAQMRSTMRLKETNIEHQFASRSIVPQLNVNGVLVQSLQPQYSLSVVEALSNPNKRYGKISSHVLEARGLGDLSLDLSLRPFSFLTLGVRGDLPTSEKATAEYLFEPLLGSNGHTNIAAYLMAHKDVFHFSHGAVALRGYGQYQAQLSGSERRTFDLTASGPWSRYLLLLSYDNDAAVAGGQNAYAVDSGVNILTRPVHVSLLQNVTLGARIEARFKAFSASVGYSVFVREAEKLSLRGSMPEHTFIAGQFAPAGGVVAPEHKVFAGEKSGANVVSVDQDILINVNAGNDPAANADLALTNADLNVRGASMPQYFSRQVVGSLGYSGRVAGQLLHAHIGGSYEMIRAGTSSNDVYSVFGMLTLKI